MNDLTQIWQSAPIPEGPIVLRKALPEDVKVKMTALMASLPAMDYDCYYGVAAGDSKGFMPIGHDAYEVIIEARKLKSK
jgi:phosphonate transport system substrate-binding protein